VGQLDIVPTTIQVIRQVRRKYAREYGRCTRTAPMAPQPILKSLALAATPAAISSSHPKVDQ